jgi:hypothetical protein
MQWKWDGDPFEIQDYRWSRLGLTPSNDINQQTQAITHVKVYKPRLSMV